MLGDDVLDEEALDDDDDMSDMVGDGAAVADRPDIT